MKSEELLKHMTDTVSLSFDRLDTVRRGALNELKSFKQVKRDVLKKQKARLTKKLGPEHQKVVAVDKKMRDIDHMSRDLDVLITEADIKAAPVDKNTWKIHGKVIGKDRKGIEGLTIALYDEKGKWLREMGYGCTGIQGYFSIVYTAGTKAEQPVSPDKKLFLYILNQKNKVLYKDDAPLFVSPGDTDYKTIYLTGKNDVCVPPEPGREDIELERR